MEEVIIRSNHKKLKASIEEAGKWLQENSEALAQDINGKTGMDIMISYRFDGSYQPEISVNYDYLSEKVMRKLFGVEGVNHGEGK